MTILAALGLLLLTESGVPIPVPGDAAMLFVGERASAGDLSVAMAALALEMVTLLGTCALYAAARGPGRALVTKVGPRVGVTEERLARTTAYLERRGAPALAVGRLTPGARTLTVVAAASSIGPRRALPPLLLGSTIFLQTHLALGYVLGPAAREALERARGPAAIVLAGLAVAALVYSVATKGRRRGAHTWAEAACPACLAIAHIAPTDEVIART